jgi:Ca2+-binding RTX toxin-like protein
LLPTPLTTSGRFFYYGETNSNDFSSYVIVSDGAITDPNPEPATVTIFGTPGNDTFRIGVGLNKHLAFIDTTVYGGLGHDAIYGAFGDDTLVGGGGKDTISGGAGNDWIFGRGSNDVLKGGSGKDAFVFDTKPNRYNLDRIVDFTTKDDTVYLENAIFTKAGKGSLDSPIKLKQAAFWTGAAAHDSSDRVIYDKSTGALYYDRDGTGAAEQVQFAKLSAGLKMTYHDFFVI